MTEDEEDHRGFLENLKIFSFAISDPQEAEQRQHVGGQVRRLGQGVRGVSAPELQNTPSLRQKQRPGAASMSHTTTTLTSGATLTPQLF